VFFFSSKSPFGEGNILNIKLGRTLLAVLTGIVAGCGMSGGATTSNKDSSGYAERVYRGLVAASHGGLAITVSTQASGSLTELAGSRFEDVLKTPKMVLVTRTTSTDIVAAALAPRGQENDAFFAGQRIDGFEANGHPLAEGSYRILAVHLSVGGDAADYLALEATWPDFSIVVDPVVEQADAMAEAHEAVHPVSAKLATDPAGVDTSTDTNTTDTSGTVIDGAVAGSAAETSTAVTDVSVGSAIPVSERPTPAGVSSDAAAKTVYYCSLASHTRWGGETLTWKAYTSHVNDIFGLHLVDFDMAKQQVGINCNETASGACMPEAFGISTNSSCSGNVGWSCACKDTGVTHGSTGHEEKVASETRCTANNPLKANASVSYEKDGVTASFGIDWDSHGASDDINNGGTVLDTCNWHQ
jgi:hypothetical protein